MNTYFLEQLVELPNAVLNGQNLITLPPSVLTIGNFDGVHLGHQTMLAQVRALANEKNLSPAVMIFEPQPLEFFSPDTAPARLTNLAEKQTLLANYGVETLIIARFDSDFRALSAKKFADILAECLNVKALVLGDDFCFGHDRSGNGQFLADYGLSVTTINTVTDDPDARLRISSTRIRDLLMAGDLDAANTLLGRDYAIIGSVVGGDKIGRTLDFPTANVDLARLKPAIHGIFAVDAVCLDQYGEVIPNGLRKKAINQQTGVGGMRSHSLFGTASVGTRPSVDKDHNWRLEIHFPKLNADLYGLTLQVRFLHFLHGERHYEGLEALKAGIHDDVAALLEWRESKRL